MSVVLIFVREWNASYRQLSYHFGFNLMNSLRFYLSLVRG
jgi:hypothetical protein